MTKAILLLTLLCLTALFIGGKIKRHKELEEETRFKSNLQYFMDEEFNSQKQKNIHKKDKT